MGDWERKSFIVILILWLFSVTAVFIVNNHYKKIYKEDITYSSSLEYGIDGISTQDAQISGWCIKPGASVCTFDMSVILWSDVLGYGYVVPAVMQKRTDVDAYMDDGYSYENAGFLCYINNQSIKKTVYEILILYQCNDDYGIVSTGHYYTSGYDVVYKTPQLSNGLVSYIDEVSVKDAVITGWCIEKGKNINSFQMDVILWDQEKRYGYQMPAYMENREDITKYFDDGASYDKSGFWCRFENNWIQEGNYNIYLRYRCDGADEVVDTGQYYSFDTQVIEIYEELDTKENLVFELEDLSEEISAISGFCILPGKSIEIYKMSVIFWKEEQGYGYVVPAFMTYRPDITQKFDDGCNYDKCGFYCDYKDKLPFDGEYEIYIQYNCDGNKEIVDTGSSVFVGEESS